MFLFDGCDHQNLKDESSRLKVKAPSHGRRAKNRVKMTWWMRYHSVLALHLFCQDGRQYKGQWVDNSTSAKRCVCVCFRLFSCFSGRWYANVLNMIFFVLSSSVCLEFGIMEQNSVTKICHDLSTSAQAKL